MSDPLSLVSSVRAELEDWYAEKPSRPDIAALCDWVETLNRDLLAQHLRADRAEAETARLRQFFEKCWDHARDGTDVDGFDVQDWGEQLGLLKPVEATAPCGEGCYCAEYYGEFPATCYRLVWGASRPGEHQP